jgi:hypothetical protein
MQISAVQKNEIRPSAIPRKRASTFSKPSSRSKVSPNAHRRVSEDQIVGWLGGADLTDNGRDSTNLDQKPGPVHTARALTDIQVKALASEILHQRNLPSISNLILDVQAGIVHARGSVSSKGERLLIIYVLKQSPGVRGVVDSLSIRSKSISRRATASSFELPDFPWALGIPDLRSPFTPSSNLLGKVKHSRTASVVVGLTLIALFLWVRSSTPSVAVYPVKGKVIMEGVALPQASVVLHPVGKSKLPQGLSPRATAREDGSFTVATFARADGAPEGEFVATVHLLKQVIVDGDSIPGPNVLPEVYSRPETSPFRVSINRDTKELAVLELHKTSVR